MRLAAEENLVANPPHLPTSASLRRAPSSPRWGEVIMAAVPATKAAMAKGATAARTTGRAATAGLGKGFLQDLWYFADLSSELKPGKLARYEILGEPVLLGRNRAGEAFALRDICPHRAAPLSAGSLTRDGAGAEVVQCPYHGWMF